ETEGALCNYKGGYLHIFTSTLWISNLKELISQSTGIEEDKIIINCTKSSEKNTNSLWQNGILCSLAAIASIKTGKPVKLSLSRSEQEEVIENPSEVKIYHKTAVDKSGIIKAMNIIVDYDSGFYNPFASYILDRLVLASTGIYNCKNVKINARAYKTHRAPSSMCFSQIDSQAFFAIENQIQKIAEITGFSPVELRQMNKAGTLQKLTSPFTFSFGRSSDVINAVAIRSDFKRKYTVARLSGHDRYEADNNFPYSPPQYGIGMACAFEGTGFLGEKFSKEQISMQISVNNDKKIIIHSLPSSARIKEIWTKLILENIETEKRNIIFTSEIQNTSAKTAKIQQIPDNFIGNISIKTILLKKCIDSLKNKKIDGSSYTIKKSIPAARKNLWNQNEFSGTPFYNTAFGACTVELELDKCTYTEKLQKICVIIDAGKIINPKAAENEIHRSIQNCLNFLVKNKTFTCPEIKIQFTQSEEEPKQIGGLIYSILPAAYTSALSQALSSQIEYLPLQTDSIFKYIEKNENNKKLKIEDEQ
uniref:molybdopterin cofactor-binding domain-containing protein n=1 Tax=Treponema sp. TaxID=166 RepID=UPI00388E2F51